MDEGIAVAGLESETLGRLAEITAEMEARAVRARAMCEQLDELKAQAAELLRLMEAVASEVPGGGLR